MAKHLHLLFTISLVLLTISSLCESRKYSDIVRDYVKKQVQNSSGEEENIFPYIQPSLFPNVGPYVKFANFDRLHPIIIPKVIRENLIWRRSPEISCGGFQAHYIVNMTGIPSMNGTRDKENKWFGYWHGTNVCRVPVPACFTRNYQKYNFLGATEELGQKDLQTMNLRRLINKHGAEDFSFHFETYILPQEFQKFKEAWSRHENKLWIIKPHQGYLSKGVKVIDHWSEIPNNTRLTTVQKYLDSPYLIRGRKFELRFYVLATSFNPLRLYVYGDGVTKIGYKNFTQDPKFKSDPCIHVRVKDPATECPGSTIDADFHNGIYLGENSKIFQMLEKEGGVNVQKLQEDMDDAIVKTMLSADEKVDIATRATHFNRYNGFQIWAFDFLIDTDSKVWLIEVNSIPGLSVETDEDVRLEFPMTQEILNLVGYQFPPILSEDAKLILIQSVENFTGDDDDPTFNEKLYTFELSEIDKLKQSKFVDWKYNSSAIDSKMCNILEDLSSDDIKQLVVAEDELNRAKLFRRIFPAKGMRKYLKYVEMNPYYYLLMDAWEHRYGSNRPEGIARLSQYTRIGIHLK